MTHPDRIRHASRQKPVRYVLFDLLYHQGKPLLQEPLSRRRTVLAELLTAIDAPALMFSEGTAESGRRFFERMVAEGHEGGHGQTPKQPLLAGHSNGGHVSTHKVLTERKK